MDRSALPPDAERAVEKIKQADIVIGIPSFNNARTIGHVVKACYAGLSKYYPQLSGVVINSDGGSTDGTREAVLSATIEENTLMLLSTPLFPLHRLSLPYHGVPGKGSAFRMVFEMARRLGARACAVVDSDLRSITPEWIDLLVRPILLDSPSGHRRSDRAGGRLAESISRPLHARVGVQREPSLSTATCCGSKGHGAVHRNRCRGRLSELCPECVPDRLHYSRWRTGTRRQSCHRNWRVHSCAALSSCPTVKAGR
jgi:glycosyltransferase involved in cell wall biosynthesis